MARGSNDGVNMLNVVVTTETKALRILCRGVLEAETVGRFAEAAARALALREARVVLDMGDLIHLDSSGLAALSHLFRRLAQAGRRLEVEGLRGQPLALLRGLGLDAMLGAPDARGPRRRAFGALLAGRA